jgi:hypothetical protein
MLLNTNQSESELLGVFKTSRGVRVETRDTEGEILESVYIEEPQFESEPESMPSMVNTGYGLIPMPKSNQLKGKPVVDILDVASGLTREWNDDSRVKDSWSFITDRFHNSDLMNLHTGWDLVHAYATNPSMKVCDSCRLQVNKYKDCSWCNLGK